MSEATETAPADLVARWRMITALVVIGWVLSVGGLLIWHFNAAQKAEDERRVDHHVLNAVLEYCLPKVSGENEACDRLIYAYDSAP